MNSGGDVLRVSELPFGDDLYRARRPAFPDGANDQWAGGKRHVSEYDLEA